MLVRVALLWFVGITLRVTLLAVPPVIPLIHRDLGLNETAVGALSSLPILLFAAAAIPGSLLIARAGLRYAVIAGLSLVAIFSATRGLFLSTPILFASTFLMGVGIAILQPAMPVLVKNWFPEKVAMATAVYTNGLLVGQTLGAGLTLPIVLPLAQGSWQMAFVLWAVPVAVIAVAIAVSMRDEQVPRSDRARRWWPDWRDKRTWQLGIVLGGSSSLYFAANAFLPDLLHVSSRGNLIAATLTSMSLCQIPAPVLVLFAGRYLVGRRVPFVMTGVLSVLALCGLLISGGSGVVIWAGVLGFCTAFNLTLGLALPALLVNPADVHRLSAAMFAVAYGCAVAVPVVGGILWDIFSAASLAFVPAFLAAFTVIGVAAIVDLKTPSRALR